MLPYVCFCEVALFRFYFGLTRLVATGAVVCVVAGVWVNYCLGGLLVGLVDCVRLACVLALLCFNSGWGVGCMGLLRLGLLCV